MNCVPDVECVDSCGIHIRRCCRSSREIWRVDKIEDSRGLRSGHAGFMRDDIVTTKGLDVSTKRNLYTKKCTRYF
jgi:hypothetical protein